MLVSEKDPSPRLRHVIQVTAVVSLFFVFVFCGAYWISHKNLNLVRKSPQGRFELPSLPTEIDDGAAWQELQKRNSAQLKSWGWLDRSRLFVHVPIDFSMDEVSKNPRLLEPLLESSSKAAEKTTGGNAK